MPSGLDKADMSMVSSTQVTSELLTTDSSILKLHKEDAFSFLKMGANTLGVDVLIDLNESGEAMKMRMKPSAYFLENITKGFIGEMLTNQMFFAECLLQSDRKSRITPVINLPRSYDSKTVEEEIADVKNTYGADRFNSMMEVVHKKYKGNEAKIKAESIKLCYSPLWMLNDEEIEQRMNREIYTRNDIIKMDYSCIAIKNLLEDPQVNILDMDQKEIFDYLDAFIGPFLINNTPIFDPESGAELLGGGEEESKLLTTVGGAQAIVAVNQAVSKGEMSEDAAELFLTLSFKVTPENARKLIDQGKSKNLEQLPE